MKLDEFAFVNQQLAGMLQSGMPLEGALKELCQGSASGKLKAELTALEKDLAAGRSLEDAIATRELPELYQQAIKAGARANDLPSVLSSLASHYARLHSAWERVRGILVYPVLVLLTATLVSLVASFFVSKLIHLFAPEFFDRAIWVWGRNRSEFISTQALLWQTWTPTACLAVASLVALALVRIKSIPRRLNWWLPALREVQLSNFASSMSVMLRGGVPLPESLALLGASHREDPLGPELDGLHERVRAGEKSVATVLKPSRLIPPLFAWAVSSSGNDLAAGFDKAADIYERRARYRTDLMLNLFLPVAIVVLGMIIVMQALPLFRWLGTMMQMFGF